MPEYSNDQIDQVRELERAVLGGLMLETERYDNVRLVISHADFQGKDHQSIFESMGDLVNAGKPPIITTFFPSAEIFFSGSIYSPESSLFC